ncbi:MAG: DUF1847 domain-containing protein [Dehalococcoidia bacterium]
MEMKTDCARCSSFKCYREETNQAPENCPMVRHSDAVKRALKTYEESETKEFAKEASIQEYECYMNLPEGRTPRNPRVEEVAQFAKKLGYKRLGIAFCVGLRNEALTLTDILENRGFDVVSVCCKAGSVPKEQIGVSREQKIAGPDVREAMCNPIAQAQILNDEETDFNIAVGLCVGHDSLFFRHCKAPVTVLIAKDRVFGHNPAAGLYLSDSYYSKLKRKE